MSETAWEISPRELYDLLSLQDTDTILIDCRTAAERLINRIEPSLHIPMDQIANARDVIGNLENRSIVVYCHHGSRSLAMTSILRRLGFDSVRSLAGGIDRWSEEVDPTMPRY